MTSEQLQLILKSVNQSVGGAWHMSITQLSVLSRLPGPVYAGLSTAEDCGILHGCENGRCIRVAEGYTCDCYPGYELDMTSMTCIGMKNQSEVNCCLLTSELTLTHSVMKLLLSLQTAVWNVTNMSVCVCVCRHKRVWGQSQVGVPVCERPLREHRRLFPLHL